MLDPKLIQSIQNLVDYNYSDELRDFEEQLELGESGEGHIFADIELIQTWLDSHYTELPRVTVHKNDQLLGEFWGPDAVTRAHLLMEPGEEYDMSVSDDRCSDCGEVFWHEARIPAEPYGWACPYCEGGVKND